MITNFTIRPTQYVYKCPVCKADLVPYTATVREVVAESQLYPAECVVYLHEPCPECGAEGEQ